MGVLTIGLFTVLISGIFFLALKYTMGIRVKESEELEGLDVGEHGMEAYSGFVKEASSPDLIGFGNR